MIVVTLSRRCVFPLTPCKLLCTTISLTIRSAFVYHTQHRLNEPFLKVALEGYYVRFTVGEAGGKPICRMCRVVSVDLNSRPYKLAETNEMCTVRLSLEFAGSVKKLNRICQVSNSRITEDEFKFYFERSGTCVVVW